MTFGRLTISENLIRAVILAVALIGTGVGVGYKLNRLEGKIDNLAFDICRRIPQDEWFQYRTCSTLPSGNFQLTSGVTP